MTGTPATDRPRGVCGNCWATWRADKSRSAILYCHHKRIAAKRVLDGWRVLEGVTPDDAAFLRRADAENET